MMLLKLCAIPLASCPTICKRSARSSRAASFTRSRSDKSRSIAALMASPASRTTGSGKKTPDAGRKVSKPKMPRERPGIRSDTQAQPCRPNVMSVVFGSPGGSKATFRTATMPSPASSICSGKVSAASGHPDGYGEPSTDQA